MKQEINPVVAIVAIVLVVAVVAAVWMMRSGKAGGNVSPAEQIRMMQQNTKTPMSGGQR